MISLTPALNLVRSMVEDIDNIAHPGLICGRCKGNPFGQIIVPDGVAIIGSGAFEDCTNITSAYLPDSVKSIRKHAFLCCTTMSEVRLPSSLTSIGDGAFSTCESLRGIDIPDGVTSIGADAFRDCSHMTSVSLPSTLKTIGESAFEGCYSLASIEVPKAVKEIKAFTFRGCNRLKYAVIPDGCKVSDRAFSDWNKFELRTHAQHLRIIEEEAAQERKRVASGIVAARANDSVDAVGMQEPSAADVRMPQKQQVR